MNKVEKSILQTIIFYDLLEKPLTLEEIWHYLYCEKANKLQVLMGLKNLLAEKIIDQETSPNQNIYYFLFGRQKIVPDYFNKYRVSLDRWKKVHRVVNLLKFLPYIKNISVINSLSYNNSNEDSDIDILIVAKKGRLWTARAFAILLLEIIGQNKNKWYRAGKFCLGFAFDETRLNLAGLKFSDDIDFTYLFANLTPVYDRGIYNKMIDENPWVIEELPNWQPKKCKIQNTKFRIIEKMLSGRFGDRLEKWLAKIQIKKIKQDPIFANRTDFVVAERSLMNLPPLGVRKKRQNQWQDLTKKCGKLK